MTVRRGSTFARFTDPDLSDPSDVEAVARELGDLVACGHRPIGLDFSGVGRVTSRHWSVLAHCADLLVAGQLRLCEVPRNLADGDAMAGWVQGLKSEADVRSDPDVERPDGGSSHRAFPLRVDSMAYA